MQTFPLATYSDIPYTDIASSGTTDAFLIRQANLVLNDAYYSHLYHETMKTSTHREAVDVLLAAGCFDDKLDERIEYPTNYMSAPYPVMKKQFERAHAENPEIRKAIIVTTGSYDPMHEGHIESVVRAREFIESTGKGKVIAGIMSASHDHYVRRKNPGGVVAEQRIHDNAIFLENSPHNAEEQWIYHDNWESLGFIVSTNFTDVLNYISGMVKLYVNDDIDIYYVYGSDNAYFGLAFDHGIEGMVKGICIGRPGYELRPDMRERLKNSTTIFYTQGTNSMSSTQVRAQRAAKLNEAEKSFSRPFVVRDDLVLSGQWMEERVIELESRRHEFMNTLTATFGKSFSRLRTINVQDQIRDTHAYMNENHAESKVLSCDVYVDGDRTVRGSRLFDIASSQSHGKETYYHTGEPNPDNDVTEYVFLDDDIVSGFFLSKVKEHFNISGAVSMAEIYLKEPMLDIVDARDFLLGSVNGGLMMDAGKPFRAPYLSPFVDLISRASIPGEDIREFNHAIWTANADFYDGTGLTVRELPDTASHFLTYLGFKENDDISAICRYYAERFFS